MIFGGLGMAAAILFFVIAIMKTRIENWQMKSSPKYNERHRSKYVQIEPESLAIRNGLPPRKNEELILRGETLVMKPDKKSQKDKNIVAVPFTQIAKVHIKEMKHWSHGSFYNLLIWRNDRRPEVPLGDRLPNYAFPFRPIALEAVQEVEQQVNAYLAAQKKS